MTDLDIPNYEIYLQVIYPNATTAGMYMDVAIRYQKEFGNEITKENIFKYLVKYKNNVVNRSALKAICRHLELEIKIPPPRSRKGKKEKAKYLEHEEVLQIIETLPNFEKLIVQLFFETGLRLRELMNIPIKGINCPQRRLKGTGKGNAPFNVIISEDCATKLMRHLALYNYDTYPFHYPSIKYSGRKFWYKLRKHCDKIGLGKVHPHQLRHALGHHLRTELDFDLEQIRSVLRHKDISTTQIYVTASREEIETKLKTEMFNQNGGK